ncbi:MAG: hypothetical protein H0U95_11380 [Bacteroidetes bacterium]|nr:hypothetical protein [Bacteroidota bacterium]
MPKKHVIYYLLVLQAIICTFSIIFFNGTCDNADSLVHYLFAKYAPLHPKLFFDHWAKPVYVILASPFAQLGFTGIKIFNSIISLMTIFYTYKTAEILKLKNALLVIVIMMFAPLNYIITFSGLTEPLFALFTILGIFFCARQKYLSASVIISFLPYVRSEGLIIIGVFSLYFIIKKAWRVLPFLLSGSIFFSIAGYFVYHDLLWVFTKIPYATLSSVYGKGPLLHFVEELINVLGVPLYALLWIGFILIWVKILKRKAQIEEVFLLLFGFGAFVVAHSLFWYLGIFNSLGLKRVLIGIMPIMAIIALLGFNFLSDYFFRAKKIPNLILQVLLITYIIIFPFTINPAAIHWQKEMRLGKDQVLANQMSKYFLEKNDTHHLFIYDHQQLSIGMGIDPFDDTKCKNISKGNILAMKPGDVIIWENIFAEDEADIKKDEIEKIPGLVKLCSYDAIADGKELIFSAYKKE